MTKRLAPAVLAAYALSLMGVYAGLPTEPEHELHLFLSSHYARSFFDLFDPRWYGGFVVSGHPPLFHECVALIGRLPLVGLERAYALLLLSTVIATVAATYLFVRAWLDGASARRAALWMALNPLLYLLVFPLGQGPFVLSVALGVAAAAFFRSSAAAAILLASAALTCHPLAALPIGAGLLFSIRDKRFVSAFGGAVAIGLITGVVLWPFLESQLTAKSRELPLGVSGSDALTIACALVIGAVALLAFWSKRDARVFSGAAIVLLLLAASHQTKIPAEKLLWFASAAAIVGVSALEARRPIVTWCISFFLLLSCSFALADRQLKPGRDRRAALSEVTQFLARPGQDHWRYLTLGLGNERLEISRRVSVGSIDGGMPWLNVIPELADSPYYSLDDLPLGDAAAREVLQRVLARAHDMGLRWVVSTRSEADALLKDAGYRSIGAWSGAVVLWANDSIAEVSAEPRSRSSVLWGVAPLSLLALGLVFSLRQEVGAYRRRQEREGQAAPRHGDEAAL